MTEFVRAEYYDDFASKVYRLRSDDRFCDVDVHVGEKLFRCHRLILSSASEYFKVMFNEKVQEGSSSKVVLRDIEANVFEEILRFMYTGEAMLSNSNIYDVIQAAEFCELPFLIKFCRVFMEKNLNVVSAEVILKVFSYARYFEMRQLVEFLSKHIYENFDNFSNDPQFAELTFDDLMEILEPVAGGPAVPIQDRYIEGVLVWIMHQKNMSPDEKKSYSDRLMKIIDSTKLSAEFIQHWLPKFMVVLASQGTSVKGSTQAPSGLQRCPKLLRAYVTKSSSCARVPPVTSIYTGFSSSTLSKWVHSGDLDYRFDHMKNVVIDGRIYSFGYSSRAFGKSPQQTFICSSSLSMYPCSRLSLPPCLLQYEFDMCAAANEIYVHTKWRPLSLTYSRSPPCENSVWSEDELFRGLYYYKRDIDQWFPLPSPKFLFAYACMTCDDERLYLIGGAHSEGCIQAYDRRTREWSVLSPTRHAYFEPSCCSYREEIMIVGGSHDPNSVEMYEPISGRSLRLKNFYNTIPDKQYLVNWPDQFSGGRDSLVSYYRGLYPNSKIMRMDAPPIDHDGWSPLPNLYDSLTDRDLSVGNAYDIVDMITF